MPHDALDRQKDKETTDPNWGDRWRHKTRKPTPECLCKPHRDAHGQVSQAIWSRAWWPRVRMTRDRLGGRTVCRAELRFPDRSKKEEV